MKYYKTGNDIYIGDPFGDAIELTEAEYNAEMNKKKESNIREVRDQLIKNIEWRVKRHESEVRMGVTPSESISVLDEYIQKLRDIPQQEGFPTNVVFPEEV